MLRNTIKGLLLAAAVMMAPAAFAENPNAGMYTTVTTCAPDYNVTTCAPNYNVTTATPYQVCNPYSVTTGLGYNACSVGGDRARSSGDFAMAGSCSEATLTTNYPNCSIAYNYSTQVVAGACTTSLVKGACTTTQVPVNSGGTCTMQSHHCNNGGGPGG